MSGDTIRGQRFGTARRGFDPGQVSAFMNRVAEQVETLQRRVAELESESVAGPAGTAETGSTDPYATMSPQLVGLMKAFDQDVERLRKEAEADADRATADARVESERIRMDAEIRAKEVLAAARGSLERLKREAEAEIAQLTEKRESIASELRTVRERLLAAIDQLPQPESPEASARPDSADVVEIVDESVGR
jgi:cell division initiation protein